MTALTEAPSSAEDGMEHPPQGWLTPARRLTGPLLCRIAMVCLVAGLLASGVLAAVRWRTEVASLQDELKALHTGLGGLIARAVSEGDALRLDQSLRAIADLPGILEVAVLDPSGAALRRVAGQSPPAASMAWLPAWPLTQAITLHNLQQQAPAVELVIVADKRRIVGRIMAAVVVDVAVCLGSLGLALVLLTLLLERRLTGPSLDLVRQAGALHPARDSAMSLTVPATADQTLNKLVAALNQLMHRVGRAIDREALRADALARQLDGLEHTRASLVESEKMAALGALVAGVAHEINTPVGLGLTGASHMRFLIQRLSEQQRLGELTEADLSHFMADAAELALSITRSLERAAHLVQSFNMVAVDQSHAEHRWFTPHSYIQDLLLTHDAMLRLSGVKASVEAPTTLSVFSDPGAWAQVLSSLISNAVVHAFAERPPRALIRIRVEETIDSVLVSVADNGAGMSTEVRQRIFEPFFTTRRGRGGSGLGLHIVYNLVTQRLKGSIDVDSRPGGGSRFRMALPKLTVLTASDVDDHGVSAG